MEVETTLSETMGTAGINARLDKACKKLLSEKYILAWIMKSCLAEYRDHSIKDIAEKYIEGQPAVDSVPVAPDKTNPLFAACVLRTLLRQRGPSPMMCGSMPTLRAQRS